MKIKVNILIMLIFVNYLNSSVSQQSYTFFKCCKKNDQYSLSLILEDKKFNINTQNKDGLTGLMHAAVNENLTICKALLIRNINIDLTDDLMETALMKAAKNRGCLEICILLLQHGSNINIVNNNGHTAFTIAALKQNTNICEAILENDLDKKAEIRFPEGIDLDRTLRYAAKYGNIKTCQYFIKHGANINSVDRFNETPLIKAARNGFLEICELLIANGAPISEKNKEGSNALHIASHKGHLDICNLLINYK